MAGASGKKLDEVYKLAWLRGLKTTYYLRTMAATHVEKSTVAHGALNSVPSGESGGGTGGVGLGGGGRDRAGGRRRARERFGLACPGGRTPCDSSCNDCCIGFEPDDRQRGRER